ncbi:XPA binding protein 1 [Theileria orientalis strain Shintoku]|uniref:GPN-loop GTPase n=1 Tax=Theileria orientalis strain Shintoku TaxID=869250 RepID=J4C302_THEOR|nr:LOW QUALITY PROTEIN: XPA binding protein 1 [Theileria orientalis strain Shintoku]BAM39586.1 XPA binding protein 1 [Theileria orientalis strain Shintoku]|eukprot:XP_009689887.1 LOW QUALITY PROTEIN: XPA binding protein 1 [Theileria orientalis strain Shintoku]
MDSDAPVIDRPVAAKGRKTLAIVVIGMAGSGKTCYVRKLIDTLKNNKKRVYAINLDPAKNVDIRDSINYRQIMKKYNLGPNGAIMTSLNIFVKGFEDEKHEYRFDKILELLDKRSEMVDYIVLDTPGQIEVFNWSASGTIILGKNKKPVVTVKQSLSSSFPTMVNYLIDTTRSQNPITFMTNMIYACSVMYKCQLPFVACFNKIDVNRHEVCLEWMQDYEQFYEAITQDESYMASFSRSCALMLNEFYTNIKVIKVDVNKQLDNKGEGFEEHVSLLNECVEEYNRVYLPWLEEKRCKVQQQLK